MSAVAPYPSSSDAVLQALIDLRKEMKEDLATIKGDLSLSFAQGLSTVSLALAGLTEAHHKAVLEQERRNAEFATRHLLADTERRTQDMAQRIAMHQARIEALVQSVDQLAQDHDALDRQVADQTKHVLSGVVGYIMLASITVAGGASGAVLGHLIR